MTLVRPDSVLARTAEELRIAHAVDPLGAPVRCQRCGHPFPCDVARLAAEVCRAAGSTGVAETEEAEDRAVAAGRVPASRAAA
jgi:hypothetical protein